MQGVVEFVLARWSRDVPLGKTGLCHKYHAQHQVGHFINARNHIYERDVLHDTGDNAV